MRRWTDKLRQAFRRRGTAPAAPPATNAGGVKAAPASRPPAQPARPPSTDETYAAFEADVLPLLLTLKTLPRDAQGREFFLRVDIVHPGSSPDPAPARIDVWLFHTREGKPAAKPWGEPPGNHFISLESKRSTPERPDYNQLLALSETPVLRLSFVPDAPPDQRLCGYSYKERYEPPQAGRTYNVYCGGYGLLIETTPDIPLARIGDFVPLVEDWLKTHAPDRIAEVRGRLSPSSARHLLQHDISLPPPVTIRKRSPQP